MLTIFAKNPIIDVWIRPEYVSAQGDKLRSYNTI